MSVMVRAKFRTSWAILTLAVLASCNYKPTEVYEIPDGYRGWVQVRMKRSWCPPLPTGPDGSVVFRIGSDGTLCTSSELDTRWGYHRYYYARGGQRLRRLSDDHEADSMIWGGEYHGSARKTGADDRSPYRDRTVFFVGTRSEYERRKPLERER